MTAARTPTNLTGTAGEYFTAAELSVRGWLATMTIKNAPDTDILAQHATTGQLISVQTKTATGKWFRPKAMEEHPAGSERQWFEWFVFVLLPKEPGKRPDFFVIPRHHLSAIAHVTHREFSERKGRDPGQMAISPAWVVGYHERWEDMECDPSSLPYCGDDTR